MRGLATLAAIVRHSPKKLIKPLKTQERWGNTTYWTDGPHKQFGITVVLCEGAGAIYTKEATRDWRRAVPSFCPP